jgi:hypothetical protein
MRTAGSIFVSQRGRKTFFSGVRSFGAAAPRRGGIRRNDAHIKKRRASLSEPSQDSVFFREITRYGRGLETADAGP